MEIVHVDPRDLHVPPSRMAGADPYKLHQQIKRYGTSSSSMPPIWAHRGTDGELVIYNGVTRATRIAKLDPGTTVPVEVIDQLAHGVGHLPTIGERI